MLYTFYNQDILCYPQDDKGHQSYDVKVFQKLSIKSVLLLLLLLLFNGINNVSATTPTISTSEREIPQISDCHNEENCKRDEKDPYESFNRAIFSFNDWFDTYIFKPVAQGYAFITPRIVRTGIHNFFVNLKEPTTIINSVLQWDWLNVAKSSTRFVVNSTIGIVGFIDWSNTLSLFRQEESFNQTLAVWGVDSGPYLVLPFLGPSTLRGSVGAFTLDASIDTLNYYRRSTQGEDYYVPLFVLDKIQLRENFLEREKLLNFDFMDKYDLYKNIYFQYTQNAIFNGSPPTPIEPEDGVDDETDEELDAILE